MTDITTTTDTEVETISFVRDNRSVTLGELGRAEAARAEAVTRATELEARNARLEAEVQQLRFEQITDGADSRLVAFWERAGEIADEEGFCNEYDRLAESFNGVPRERDFEVRLDVTVTLTVYKSVTARDSDSAGSIASDEIDSDDVIEAIRSRGTDGIDVDDWSAERS